MENQSAEEASVWSNFKSSIAYVKEVAQLYDSVFGHIPDSASCDHRKIVTKTHLDEGHNQAQQALELLASNVLNASMAIVVSVEKQENESELLRHKILAIRQSICDRQVILDQEDCFRDASRKKD